jgi:hypothetical protein
MPAYIPKDGGYAFPFPGPTEGEYTRDRNEGMTLRDYFAASCPMTLAEYTKAYGIDTLTAMMREPEEQWKTMLILFAQYRYDYADAMLEARQR